MRSAQGGVAGFPRVAEPLPRWVEPSRSQRLAQTVLNISSSEDEMMAHLYRVGLKSLIVRRVVLEALFGGA